MAVRSLSEEELVMLDARIEEARGQSEEKILEVAAKYEKDLELIGCTAIEDKL
jgi:magnesium-transporting ATPase (P-type)